MRQLEKFVLLQTIDQLWKEHLLNMDHLKEGIGLRGYAQKNPLQEYQKEGFEMFEEMIDRVHADAVQKVFTVQAVRSEELARLEERRQPQPAQTAHERRRRHGGPLRWWRAAGGEGGGSPEGRAQRSVSVRQRQEVQEVPRVVSRSRPRLPGTGASAEDAVKVEVQRHPVRVPGFRFAGVACGLKESGRRDVALIVSDAPATAVARVHDESGEGGSGRAGTGASAAAGGCRPCSSTAATPTPTRAPTVSRWRAR